MNVDGTARRFSGSHGADSSWANGGAQKCLSRRDGTWPLAGVAGTQREDGSCSCSDDGSLAPLVLLLPTEAKLFETALDLRQVTDRDGAVGVSPGQKGTVGAEHGSG